LEEEKPEEKPEKKMKLGEVIRKRYTNKSVPASSPSQFTKLFVMGGKTENKKNKNAKIGLFLIGFLEPVCKGTNCEKLIKDDGYVFLSGNLIRKRYWTVLTI
jgi:hypothetical protein